MILQTISLIIVALVFASVEVDCATTREPSIQAYGLPKKFFANNGRIEHRFNVEDETDDDLPIAPARINIGIYPGDPSIIRRKFVSKDELEDGTIELIHLDSLSSNENVKSRPRYRRTIIDEPSNSNNDEEEIMETDESKVFRPLFVYRQQVAKRQRNQREKKIVRDPKLRYNTNKSNKNSIRYYH